MSYRSHLLTALLLPLGACDPGWHIDVSVEVPAEVQAAYADRWPAQVIVMEQSLRGTHRQGMDQRIAVLCDASDADVVFHTQFSGGMSCSNETMLVARLEPLPQDARVTCGAGEGTPPRARGDRTAVRYRASASDRVSRKR